jgi:hypothetical protein
MFSFGRNSDNKGSRVNDWFNTGKSGAGLFNSYTGGSWGSGGTPWGAIADFAKSGYGAATGHNDSNYSDFEEAFVYPLQGAGKAAGYSGGNPWATLGGALYGLGYAFKDDLGLKDNNWFTTLTFPIGMGDEHKGIIQL